MSCFPLAERYRSIFSIAQNRQAFVAENWLLNGTQAGWNVQFTRNLNDWEIELAGDMLSKIQKCKLETEKKDYLKWKLCKMGCFSVKSCYESLCIKGNVKEPIFGENLSHQKLVSLHGRYGMSRF